MKIPKTPTRTQKASVQKHHAVTVAAGHYDAGALLAWDHRCPSAYWTFKGGRHEITIGEACYPNITIPEADLKSSPIGYLKALYRHERSHALYTCRDLKAIQDECSTQGVPFRLLNLFEDARIEYRSRRTERKRFNWHRWEKAPELDAQNPTGIVFALIHGEGQRDIRRRVYYLDQYKRPDGRMVSPNKTLTAIRNAKEAKSTYSVIAVVKAWMDLYGITEKEGHEAATGVGEDMKEAAAASDAPLTPFDGTSIAGPDRNNSSAMCEDKSTSYSTEAVTPVQVDMTSKQGWPSDQRGCTAIDRADAETVKHALNGLYTQGRSKVLADHGNRVNMASLATLRLPKLFHGKAEAAKAKPRILVITDMSGSMHGGPQANMAAVNVGIAQSKAVDSVHVFTSHSGARRLEQHEVTAQIGGSGANSSHEGIAAYLERHATSGHLKQYAAILCLTDGKLTDGSPDWPMLERKGVTKVVACYIGDRDYSKTLRRHFKRHLSVKNVADLAGRIKTLLS